MSKSRRGGVLRLSKAPATPVSWLWAGRMPAGRLTLLDALPGTGKTTLVASILGQITREGGRWPDGTKVETPVSAVLIAHEDDPDTLRRRIEAAGGDVSRVHLWLKNVAGHLPRIPQDLKELKKLLRSSGAKILVLEIGRAHV